MYENLLALIPMMKKLSTTLVLAIFFTLSLIQAQDNDSIALFPIFLEEPNYSGPGVDWILTESENKQFVMFGEQHGIAGLAKFTHFTYKMLYEGGFDHLILETDSWTAGELKREGLEKVTTAYPFSIAFDYDEDLELIKTALDLYEGKGDPIWGLDQMFMAIHPYDKLSQLAESAQEKRLARGAFLKSSLKMGNYIRQEHFQDLDQLDELFANNPNSETQEILQGMRTSMEIYAAWKKGQQGSISPQVSVEKREAFMKEKLDSYLAANSFSSSPPKAVLKMGGAHVMYGIGPNGVLTLGEHAKDIAAKNGMESLAIGIRRFTPERALIDSSHFQASNILLLDTKAWIAVNQIDSSTLNQRERFSLLGYDAILYIKDAGRATKKGISAKEKGFRSRVIGSLIPLGICLLLCLSSIVPVIRNLLSSKKSAGQFPLLLLFFASAILIAIIALQILWIKDYPTQYAAILSPEISLVLFAFLGIIAFYLLFSSVQMWRKAAGSVGFRIYFSVLVLSLSGLSFLSYYWNLGGMLG
ncbi:MAG: hypothetical protein AAF696_29900, partial [Bacteroidota bacterium]